VQPTVHADASGTKLNENFCNWLRWGAAISNGGCSANFNTCIPLAFGAAIAFAVKSKSPNT